MRKPFTVTLLGLVSGLVLATPALASEGSTGRQAFAIRAEQAIVQGSVAKLVALRSSLERSDKDDRYNLAYLDWRTSQLLPPVLDAERK